MHSPPKCHAHRNIPPAFSTEDFAYINGLAERVPEDATLPGVAGFKLNAPLNHADKLDEVALPMDETNTTAPQQSPITMHKADRMPEHALDPVLDDRNMRRFMPPRSNAH